MTGGAARRIGGSRAGRRRPPVHLVVGPDQHGVVECALTLATALGAEVVRTPSWLAPRDAEAAGARLPAGEPVHVHFTDHLLGRTPAAAARALASVAEGRRLTVTLHDLPQPSDGPGRRERRALGYAEAARRAAGVVVSSEHERLLLAEIAPGAAAAVVPLPVEPPGEVSPREREKTLIHPRDVGMLGFVYPGKGHAEALDVVRALAPDVGLRVIGRASDGHRALLAALTATAEAEGRRFDVTGFVPEADLTAVLRSVAVPLAAHRHVSASGSIGRWVTAGRRPLVPRDRYTTELAHRLPGALTLYDDLPAAVATALADPDGTWLPPHAGPFPGTREAARGYREVFAAWA